MKVKKKTLREFISICRNYLEAGKGSQGQLWQMHNLAKELAKQAFGTDHKHWAGFEDLINILCGHSLAADGCSEEQIIKILEILNINVE